MALVTRIGGYRKSVNAAADQFGNAQYVVREQLVGAAELT
jgi:hypothetical protein